MATYEVTGGFWVDPRDQTKRHWKGDTVDVPQEVAAPSVASHVLVEAQPTLADAPVKRGPGRPRKTEQQG